MKDYSIHGLRDKVRNEIVLRMRGNVEWFKKYVTALDHDDYSPFTEIDGKVRTNYGVNNEKYFCYLPENDILFIHKNSMWRADMIFFHDEIKCWFVRNSEEKKSVAFDALDTDTQIAFLDLLESLPL